MENIPKIVNNFINSYTIKYLLLFLKKEFTALNTPSSFLKDNTRKYIQSYWAILYLNRKNFNLWLSSYFCLAKVNKYWDSCSKCSNSSYKKQLQNNYFQDSWPPHIFSLSFHNPRNKYLMSLNQCINLKEW